MFPRIGRRLGALAAAVAMTVTAFGASTGGVAAAPLAGVHTAKAPGIDTCGSTDATFNESDILYGIGLFGTGFSARVGMFLSDEKGLSLGVNGATPNTSNPQHV